MSEIIKYFFKQRKELSGSGDVIPKLVWYGARIVVISIALSTDHHFKYTTHFMMYSILIIVLNVAFICNTELYIVLLSIFRWEYYKIFRVHVIAYRPQSNMKIKISLYAARVCVVRTVSRKTNLWSIKCLNFFFKLKITLEYLTIIQSYENDDIRIPLAWKSKENANYPFL